jgi:hypothetical protein
LFLLYKDQYLRARVSHEGTFVIYYTERAVRKIILGLPCRGITASIDFQNFLSQIPDKLISLKDGTGQISQWVLLNFSCKCSDVDSNNYYSLEIREHKN